MLNTGRSTVNNPQIESRQAAIISGCSVVPDHDNLFAGLEITDRSKMAFTAILKTKMIVNIEFNKILNDIFINSLPVCPISNRYNYV